MNLPANLPHLPVEMTVNQRAELISRYQHLRSVGTGMNNKLVDQLSKEQLHDGARKLGMLHKGTLVFDSESEMAVLMDYCLHHARRNGRTVIEETLIDSPPDEESDEMACLRAMQRNRYSIYVVESAEPGLGVNVRDVLSNQTYFLVDLGLSSTGQPGLLFASRVLFFDDFAINSGAVLPIGTLPEPQRKAFVKRIVSLVKSATDKAGVFDPASLIRACLKQGASSRIVYAEPTGESWRRLQESASTRSVKIGRNDLCPCGSGKKYKHCCLKRA